MILILYLEDSKKILLDLLEKEIGPSFKKEKSYSYSSHDKGFYVYAEKKEFKSLKDGLEYVTRYCGRVPISENRIINYDGQNVTFCYNAHENEEYHEVTLSAEDFITLLLNHLIPREFKIIRYYGFYRKKHKLHDKMIMLVHPMKIEFARKFNKWFLLSMKTFKDSPLICSKCKTVMQFQYFCT